MMTRCYNSKHTYYNYYGGRGIKVCERWLTAAFFIEDTLMSFIEHSKENGLRFTSLERIDNDKDYSPENCRWATIREQARNRSNSLFVEMKGEKRLLADIAYENDMTASTLKYRLDKGMNLDEAINTPLPKKRGPISWKGEEKSLREWGRVLGIAPTSLKARLTLGWTVDETFTTPINERLSHKKQHPGSIKNITC